MTLEGNSHLICSSQVCKQAFRLLRSYSTFESTQINFTLYELISKLKRVKFVQNWMGSLLKNGFEFNPQHIIRVTSNFEEEKLSESQCEQIICINANDACLKLGITSTQIDLKKFFLPSNADDE